MCWTQTHKTDVCLLKAKKKVSRELIAINLYYMSSITAVVPLSLYIRHQLVFDISAYFTKCYEALTTITHNCY